MVAVFIGYCCKKTDFDDDHVFQEEELPTIFFDPDDAPSTGSIFKKYLKNVIKRRRHISAVLTDWEGKSMHNNNNLYRVTPSSGNFCNLNFY